MHTLLEKEKTYLREHILTIATGEIFLLTKDVSDPVRFPWYKF